MMRFIVLERESLVGRVSQCVAAVNTKLCLIDGGETG